MKNATLLKTASLFIFLLSAQLSSGQNCSDYPNWEDYPSDTIWMNADEVHYNGKIYSPCYFSTNAPLSDPGNRDEAGCGTTNWGWVTDCSTGPAPTELFYEIFNDGQNATNGTDAYGTNWNTDEQSSSPDDFKVKNNVFLSKKTEGEAILFTETIDVGNYTDLKLSSFIDFGGNMESNDFIKFQYKLDGGVLTDVTNASYFGNNNDDTYEWPLTGITGTTLEIYITFDTDGGGEEHEIDNLKLTGVLDCSSASSEVTAAAANASNTQATVTWINPSANCITINEVLVVAKQGSDFSSATPSGNYSASTTFGSGDAFDGGTVVYSSGTAQSVSVTNLTDGAIYYFKIFTKTGSTWSSGVSVSAVCIENLFFEDFEDEADNEITGTDANGIPWTATLNGHSASYFGVDTQSGTRLFRVDDLSDEDTGIKWESNPINIAGYESLELSSYLWFDGTDDDDYLRVKVEVDGVTTTVASFEDDVNNQDGDKTWILLDGSGNPITGNSLKIIIEFFHDSNEEYRVDNIKLTGILSLPGCAEYLAPTNTATNVSVTPTLSWSAVSGATGYKVFYGTDSSTTTALDETASTSVTLPTLPEGTLHYWKVVPTNARGDASGCSVISFTTETLIPDCATGLTPADGTTGVSITTSLSWTAANGATSYKVYFDDSNATTLIYTGSNTSIAAPTLQNGTQYYWKVVATNDSGDATGCGNAISFTTIVAAPGCASYLSPTEGAVDVSLTPELSWSAVSGATGYKVYYSDNSSNLGDPITLGEVTSYQLPQLGYNTQYFWKVVPTNAGGEATGCSVISFTTLKNPAGSVFITGNTVTVSKNAYLYLEKDFTNTGGSVTLNSSSTEFASIVVGGTATGDITYNKYVNITGAQGEAWDLVGSPVLEQDMASFADINIDNSYGPLAYDGNQYAIGPYLADQGYFENYTGVLFENTIISTGGSIENAGDFPAAKGFQMATFWGATMAFTGKIASTEQIITIQNHEQASGSKWNLIANPFPSYIKGNELADGGVGNINNFISQNGENFTQDFVGIYGWRADGSGYDAYNLANLSEEGIPQALILAPGQGFMVAARYDTEKEIKFTPQMRTVTGGDDFISGAPMLLNHFLKLKLYHGNSEKENTKFFFQQGLTLGLDQGYDAGAYNQAAALSSRLPEDDQGVNFQINAMSIETAYNQSIPLVIKQQQGQNFRVSISNNTLPEDVNVYLEDTQNGTLTSLKDQDFELVAQSDLSDDGRFYIRFTTQSLATNDVLSPSSLTVFKLNTDAFVTITGLSPEMGKTSAALYNMLGMKVREKVLNTSQSAQRISTQGLASGVYIINLKAGDQAVSKKVIIQ